MSSIDAGPQLNEPDSAADVTRSNPRALPALVYRGGKYQPTIERMLASLSTQDALARLNRDAYDDWSIALLHAWAIVTDVLAFYQERITNEGYIRTITERRSVLALAGAVGYDWRPGIAASAHLALTVAPDDQDQSQRVTVPKGSAVQSTPGEGQLPQTFETSADTEVRTEWNLLFPFVGLEAAEVGGSEPLLTDVTSLRVADYRSDLQKGDVILLVDQFPPEQNKDQTTTPQTKVAGSDATTGKSPMTPDPGESAYVQATDNATTKPQAWVLGTVTEAVADPQKPYTIIRWHVDHCVGVEIRQPALYVFRRKASLFGYAQGAVYYDAEEIPPKPQTEGSPPGNQTTGEGTAGSTAKGQGKARKNGVVAGIATGGSNNGGANHSASKGTVGKINGSDNTSLAEPPAPPKPPKWTPRTLSLPNLDINTFVVNPEVKPKGVIFAGTKQDLYRSFDEGESWQAASVDPVRRNVTALTLDAVGALFAATSTGGIYLSYDNGDNWTPISGDAVAPDIKVKKAEKESFEVEPPKTLPKAPVKELEFGKDRSGNTVLYAGTDKGLYVSSDTGKTWTGPIDPTKELPEARQTLTLEEQRAALLAAAQGLLMSPKLQWLGKLLPLLEKLITPLAKGTGTAKWWGSDIWNSLVSGVRADATSGTAVRALAVSTPGKKSTVVVGTDAGKFTLKDKTRRWVVVAAILLLVLLQQFLTNRDKLSTVPMDLAAKGEMTAPSSIASVGPVMARTDLVTQGTLRIEPKLAITEATSFKEVTLTGNADLAANFDKEKSLLAIAGNLPLTGVFALKGSIPYTVEFSGMTTLDAWVAADAGVTGTVFVADTEAVTVNLTLTATALVAPANGIWPPTLTFSEITFSGTLNPSSPEAVPFPWLASIWQQVMDLLFATVIVAWDAVKAFLTSLWAALPDWLRNLLTPIYDYVIQPVVNFVDTYLIRPLVNYTAAMLVQISSITLGVLALLLAWTYTSRRMSNRETVRLTGPVNALVIRENGQILAGTDKGVFRSLEDDPNASLWKKVTRALLRRAFPDQPMEPINKGLTESEDGAPAVIRTLVITATGDLLAGTAGGHIFRSSNNGDLWRRYDEGITLKAVRTVVATPSGHFVAGEVGTDKLEDHWFTAQSREVQTPDGKKVAESEIDLDAVYPDLKAGSWIVLHQPPAATPTQGTPNIAVALYKTASVKRVTSQDFVTAGDFTRVTVHDADALTAFARTQTTALTQGEAVALFDNRPVQGKTIHLEGYIPDLNAGHVIIVKGKQKLVLIAQDLGNELLCSDNGLESRKLYPGDILQVIPAPPSQTATNGVTSTQTSGDTSDTNASSSLRRWRLRTRDGFIGTVEATSAQVRWVLPAETDPEISEVAIVCGAKIIKLSDESGLQAGIDYAYDRVNITQVELQSALEHVYDRATVTVLGNVVPATHGQTVAGEVLGSGSGMLANERFMLQERPLTYISAVNDQGADSEIRVEVNGIAWQKERYLYGLNRDHRAYIVRQDATDNTTVTFGDGKQGARLPTGTEQVTATYRIGIGPIGNVPAYTIDQPQTLPSAVRKSTNPLPASGGVGPDSIEDVRQHVPLSVRMMGGRIVALSDYEDFVRLYAGIGRVQMRVFGTGQNRLLHFTVADSDGNVIQQTSDLYQKLLKSIDQHRAVATPQIQIASYEPVYFNIEAKVLIYRDHKGRVTEIDQTIRQRLLNTFSFEQREFGRAVAESEVVALLQAVTGVAAVEGMRLRYCNAANPTGEDTPNELLKAELARNVNGKLFPAQLLLLNPGTKGIDLKIAATTDPAKVLNEREGPV